MDLYTGWTKNKIYSLELLIESSFHRKPFCYFQQIGHILIQQDNQINQGKCMIFNFEAQCHLATISLSCLNFFSHADAILFGMTNYDSELCLCRCVCCQWQHRFSQRPNPAHLTSKATVCKNGTDREETTEAASSSTLMLASFRKITSD